MVPVPRVLRVDGRQLTVEDAGPEDGFPVLVHSPGGSRHLAPAALRQARQFQIRLISFDRPGYGGSTPMPGRSIADSTADVECVLHGLNLTRVAVWGFSGGGPYAVATAALLPDRVIAACLFAPLGPFGVSGLDWLKGMADSYREEVRLFFADPAAAREKFRTEAAEMFDRLSRPEAWFKLWGERADQDDAHSRETAEYLALEFRDGWTNGDQGWWDDWSASLRPWGFEAEAIRTPVQLWHGLADTRCPPAHSRWLASRIPTITANFPEHDDHTTIEANHRGQAYAWLQGHLNARSD